MEFTDCFRAVQWIFGGIFGAAAIRLRAVEGIVITSVALALRLSLAELLVELMAKTNGRAK